MQLCLHRQAGELMLEQLSLSALAARQPTPFYVYSTAAIRQRVEGLQQALAGVNSQICYAVKANPNRAILQLMASLGVGADTVSIGECRRALAAGIPAQRIVFSGVGKTTEEMAAALALGIARFNVESREELLELQQVASHRNTVAIAAIRINPDVDAGTHAKISTGKAENKFGVSIAVARQCFAEARLLSHVRLSGLHVHIGSQILSITPFTEALARVAMFWRELVAAGHAIDSIDVGGGLGVRYRDEETPISAADYVAAIRLVLADFNGLLLLEPGRYLVAEAGLLISRVIRVKPAEHQQFLVLDAAMNDLLRPSLYEAWHDILPVAPEAETRTTYDVVGPVCETGDTFARNRELPTLQTGSVVAIAGAGAYGSSMSSTYNSRPLLAEYLVDGDRYAEIRQRQSFEQMVAGEQLPNDWQLLK